MSDPHHQPKYEHEFVRHDPKEGFDDTEPDSKSIFGFVIGSILLLVLVIGALQYYFDSVWKNMVQENVLSVPAPELGAQRNLEAWRMTHYEYTDKSKTTVRIPMDRARAMFMEEMKAGKAFYPGKPTEPKPETPAAAPAADAKGGDAEGKETKEGAKK